MSHGDYCDWLPSFRKLLDTGEAVVSIGCFSGNATVRSMLEVSKDFRSAFGAVRHVVQEHCPGHIYICGGFTGLFCVSSAERFDVARGVWENLPDMHQVCSGAAATVVAGQLYIVGGTDSNTRLKCVERFDPGLASWDELPDMKLGRFMAVAASLAGHLIVACGTKDTSGVNDLVESYDPSANSWQDMPSMMKPRSRAASATRRGSLFVIGGMSDRVTHLDSVESLRYADTSWSDAPPLPRKLSGACATALGGALVVCGGTDGEVRSADVFRLGADGQAWEQVRTWRAFGCAVMSGIGSSLYICGGFVAGGIRRSVQKLDSKTGQEEDLAAMSMQRMDHAGAVMAC
eukprot:TRINITY_DN10060_c0_g1_i1.p1 TRINITY_DN10060_c0_g1~~TRINITY_DN10060_c0_g1_i1.p1  ORF type:complete len:346 (+),score=46.66 TRINITY_DN10060_c0_g1_i1:80-1117(+)